MAQRANADELLGGMKLASQHRQHVHRRVRLALDQHQDVAAIDLDADRLLRRRGFGLMLGLLQHGGEAEELPRPGLVDDDFLIVVIHRRDAHAAGHHDVGAFRLGAHLVNALPRR